jgi:uncharacterized protein (TIGR03663 family)
MVSGFAVGVDVLKRFKSEQKEELRASENEQKEEQQTSENLNSSYTESAQVDGDNDITVGPVAVEPGGPVVEKEEVVESTSSSGEHESDGSALMAEDQTGSRGFGRFSRAQIWTAVAFWSVILLGAVLRFWGLGDKPLHHDESLHAYFSMILMRNNMDQWSTCFATAASSCYRYDPLTHGPFQFHIIALVYKISGLLGLPDNGINTTTVRIAAASLGTLLVALPYFIRDYLGKIGAWLSCFLLAVSPSLVYYSRFAREDIYMACFTLLLVVATARYIRDRKAGWLLTAAIAFTLCYATKESTFLLIGIFGSFLGALIAWELGVRKPLRRQLQDSSTSEAGVQDTSSPRFLLRTWGPWFVLIYFIVIGVIAKWFLGYVGNLSHYITASTANTSVADAYVAQLKHNTELILPWLGIALAVLVFVILLREQFGHVKTGRHGIAARLDPKKQPLLDTIFTMPWTHWFFALVISWFIFILLFTVLFTNMPNGIGDGIWQGLYYWLQQQQVARGGQPWYYYFLLIPLYEQIGVVFGLAGIVYCLVRPNRFRLFLVYWSLGNLAIYTWAGEKMPWLTIHMTMPLMILAALALQPAASTIWQAIKNSKFISQQASNSQDSVANSETAIGTMEDDSEIAISKTEDGSEVVVSTTPAVLPSLTRKRRSLAGAIAVLGCALILLAPTLQNMFQLSYIHQADAPHEMMIYVQTSTDINIVMDKIQQIDQKLYGGKHEVPIGVTNDTTWPFAWYVRDYTNVCFQFPTGCPATAQSIPIIIGSGDELLTMQPQYAQSYQYHQYHLRTQWDQGYMPPPCVKSATDSCSIPQPYVGVGPWLWLSYGDSPPKDAKFDLVRAATNIWNWWWHRTSFGSVTGSYDMGLFINNSVSARTGVKP